MKERLIEFLAYLKMGQTKFEEKVGLSRGFVNNVGENITSKSLKKITEVYPELNINWLKTGIGNMITNEQKSENNNGIGVIGNNVNNGSINDHTVVKDMIELLRKKDEQIDRLIGIIEKK